MYLNLNIGSSVLLKTNADVICEIMKAKCLAPGPTLACARTQQFRQVPSTSNSTAHSCLLVDGLQ